MRATSLASAPTQPDEDVGCLINTLASSLQLGSPGINTFIGKAMPGKTEVSFQTMVPWGTVHERPLSRICGLEKYHVITKGGSSRCGQVHGSYCQHSPYPSKLTVIFGTVALFHVLMQHFYKVTKNNQEKVPSFGTRLEGTLNQIRLQCPRRITDQEVQQHLKDNLFHGECKHISNSIWYLYCNPRTTYSQLMIAAHKVEIKNEKAHDKVRARSAVTTEPVEGTTELGNQIAKLMAALTRAGQGNSPGSTPNSPRQRGHGRGQMDRNTPSHPSSYNSHTGMGQTASAHSVSASHRMGTTSQGQGQNGQGPNITREALQIGRTPVPSNALDAKVEAKSLVNVPPSKEFKPVWGELRECGPTPHWHQPKKPTVGPKHSLPDPESKLTILKVAQKKGWPDVAPVPFLNPDPIAHLVEHSNEAPLIVDRQEMISLIDQMLRYPVWVLWRSCTTNPTIRSVIGARGDRGLSHAIPWIHGGQPPDPRDQKL